MEVQVGLEVLDLVIADDSAGNASILEFRARASHQQPTAAIVLLEDPEPHQIMIITFGEVAVDRLRAMIRYSMDEGRWATYARPGSGPERFVDGDPEWTVRRVSSSAPAVEFSSTRSPEVLVRLFLVDDSVGTELRADITEEVDLAVFEDMVSYAERALKDSP